VTHGTYRISRVSTPIGQPMIDAATLDLLISLELVEVDCCAPDGAWRSFRLTGEGRIMAKPRGAPAQAISLVPLSTPRTVSSKRYGR
jgi:hypothetical protein